MPFENPKFEQQKKEEESTKTSFETKEGEKFFAERLVSPEDLRVEKVQEMLEGHLSKEEVDPIEVMKEAMTGKMKTGEEVPPYLVHVAENSKGEVVGLHTSAVVETINSKGKESEDSALWLGCYAVTAPEARGRGVWKNLFEAQKQAADEDAKHRGLEIKGFMAEAHNNLEPILNKGGIKRAYIKTKEGYAELPYEQPPVDWDQKTGKPTEDAGTVPEHLMLKLASDKNKLSGKEAMEMIRGMYLYNNYREEEYFKNEKAYQKHTEFVKGIEQKLADFIGRKQIRLLSREEREVMDGKGIKFLGHREKEDKAEERVAKRAEKAEQRKGWGEYFGPLAEMQLAREKAEREAKKEKAVLEAAETSEKGMGTEEILKEVGIEKSAESYKEAQKRLKETLGKARVGVGEKISLAEKNEITRNFYLGELGYSVKYKGLLHGKAELLNEKEEVVTDKKGKPMEFKTFWSLNRKEAPMVDFLKKELKKKLEGKSAKEQTGQDKLEDGFHKAKKAAENEQEAREKKISILTGIKNLGKSSLEKLTGWFSRLAKLEELGVLGLRGGKKLAVESAKDLAVLGLTPFSAAEEGGRYVAGRIQTEKALKESMIMREKIQALKEVPVKKRPEYYNDLLWRSKVGAQIATAELIRGYDKIHNKGKILGLIEALGGYKKERI